MHKLQWHSHASTELSALLTLASLENSAAVGDSTVYHITHDGREKLAIALPDGKAIIVELSQPQHIKRRRQDPAVAQDTATALPAE
ncbi:hypothetical protein BH11PSE12_BH11PSE12_25080 [soil metagenome]